MQKLRLNHWILVSQVMLLVLVGALAWQGISAARTQDRMVRALLGDYAQLIVENAERTFNVALGFRTLYAMVQGLQSQPDLFPTDREWRSSALADAADLAVSEDEVIAVAVRNPQTGEVRVLWRHASLANNDAFFNVLEQLARAAASKAQFRVQHPEFEGATQTLVVVAVPGGSEEAVIWLEPSVIESRVRAQMDTATLLPAGKVLVVGGLGVICTTAASISSPSSATTTSIG